MAIYRLIQLVFASTGAVDRENAMRYSLPVAFLAMLGLTAPALGDEFETRMATCGDAAAVPDAIVEACSWLFDSGRLGRYAIPTTYLNRGSAYIRLGNYEQALDDLGRALARNPGMARALVKRGIANSYTGRNIHAIRDLDKAIGIRPSDPEAFIGRAQAYRNQGDMDRARSRILLKLTRILRA